MKTHFSDSFKSLVRLATSGPSDPPIERIERIDHERLQSSKIPTRKQRTEFLAQRISPGARVLDLGAGWGEVLYHLKADIGIQEFGIELRQDQVDLCQALGLQVHQADLNDLDNPVLQYALSQEWDVVLAIDTLYYWRFPAPIFSVLATNVKTAYVAIGNGGHINQRLKALKHGINFPPNLTNDGQTKRYQCDFGTAIWTYDGFHDWACELGYDVRLIARRCTDATFRRSRPFPWISDRGFLFELTSREFGKNR